MLPRTSIAVKLVSTCYSQSGKSTRRLATAIPKAPLLCALFAQLPSIVFGPKCQLLDSPKIIGFRPKSLALRCQSLEELYPAVVGIKPYRRNRRFQNANLAF